MTKRARKAAAEAVIEVTRSFSYKLNSELHGGARYESADFFMSAKTTTTESQLEKASESVYQHCRKTVIKAVQEHIEEIRSGAWARKMDLHPAAKANAQAFEEAQRRKRPATQEANVG